jgi:ribonuclease HI
MSDMARVEHVDMVRGDQPRAFYERHLSAQARLRDAEIRVAAQHGPEAAESMRQRWVAWERDVGASLSPEKVPAARRKARLNGVQRHTVAVDAMWTGGVAAFAGVLLSDAEQLLFAERMDAVLNSYEAELRAVVAAVRFAEDEGWRRVRIKSDCLAVVHVMRRRGKLPRKQPIRGFVDDARQIYNDRQPDWSIVWVPREQNRVADKAARQAFKEAA